MNLLFAGDDCAVAKAFVSVWRAFDTGAMFIVKVIIFEDGYLINCDSYLTVTWLFLTKYLLRRFYYSYFIYIHSILSLS